MDIGLWPIIQAVLAVAGSAWLVLVRIAAVLWWMIKEPEAACA